ncbi:MAG: substrate-binding domain-containing protein [Dethiobacter sp.]|nr:substrate-binding domain-containing protein [Dethiobacter sp.]MBS3899602.1 substrate-binding domain-containing protein [Dethiobacter sp.]
MNKNTYSFLIIVTLIILGLALSGCGARQAEPEETAGEDPVQIVMACTIGPIEAGIVALLGDEFEKETGIRVRHVGAGTGEAIRIAQSGAVDLVMLHAKALEEEFVVEGYGTRRYDLMYNDFVIMGPSSDPAMIRGEKSAAEAFRKIAEANALFVSRGDRSGTHVKETEIWEKAGLKPEGDWYRVFERGAEGNTATLKYADELQAYTIIDRATYLRLKNEIVAEVLVESDEILLNFFTVIPVNPQRFPDVKHEEVSKFIEWLTSDEGQSIIREFGVDEFGAPLFFPNSPAGRE